MVCPWHNKFRDTYGITCNDISQGGFSGRQNPCVGCIYTPTNRLQLDIAKKAAGIYFVSIRINNSVIIKKISIIK